MKIKGLKRAISDYKRANMDGDFSPFYGYLMFDKGDGKVWTDEFYSLGHNEWREYHSEDIVNLGQMMSEREIEINMKNVKDFIINNFEGFEENK